MTFDLKSVKFSAEWLHTSREKARAEVRRAWMKLESAVADALAGEALRGLPNLGSTLRPFYAVRLHGRHDRWLEEPEGTKLVIMRTGRVAFARRRGADVEFRLPTYDELLVEDFEPYVRALVRVLALNADRIEKTSRNYDATTRLATRIANVVGF